MSPATAAAPPDLRLPRGLPARSPSAPRASLGASARSPARPARPRGSLQSGGLSRCFPSLSQASTPHAIQNSPSTPEPSCERYKTRPAHAKHTQNSHFSQAGRILSRRLFEARRARRVLSRSPAPLFTSSHSLAQLAAMQTTRRAHEPVISHLGRGTHARMIGGTCNPRDSRAHSGACTRCDHA